MGYYPRIMPPVMVYFYQESPGNVPVWEWLSVLNRNEPHRHDALARVISQLAGSGSDLRRPRSAPLGNGLFELRKEIDRVQFRILYFFAPGGIVLLTHHLVKRTESVPLRDLELALARKRKYEANPSRHTYGDPAWWIEKWG